MKGSKSLPLLGVILLLILLSCSALGSCTLESNAGSDQRFVVVTYNVQNLFDGITDGTEYPEFRPENGWTGSAYPLRLERLAQALIQQMPYLPDVIVLQEIEHERVLEDLVKHHLLRRGFRYLAATNDPDSAIQVGIVSRHPLIEVTTHQVNGCRSILEARIESPRDDLIIFTLHAKSKIGGEKETEEFRIEAARSLQKASASAALRYPGVVQLIAGDFNESADISLRSDELGQTALVLASLHQAEHYAQKGSLLVTGSLPQPGHWYTWWLDREALFHASVPGSYRYGGVWETFDQILLNSAAFDNRGWEYHSGHVHAPSRLCNSDGTPIPFNLKRLSGYSDHLPVYVVLAWY